MHLVPICGIMSYEKWVFGIIKIARNKLMEEKTMRLKYTFEKMDLDDQIIAVPVGEAAGEFRGVVKLNETAAFIFDLLTEDMTEEAIVDALEKEYDAVREVLAADVHRYVNEFREKGLLI